MPPISFNPSLSSSSSAKSGATSGGDTVNLSGGGGNTSPGLSVGLIAAIAGGVVLALLIWKR